MKLIELIEFYGATGYVLQTAGSGSADPYWVDYSEVISICPSIGETEMHVPSASEVLDTELEAYRRAVGDDKGICMVTYVSDWVKPMADRDFCYRILF